MTRKRGDAEMQIIKDVKITKRGTVTIPSACRKKMSLKIGGWVDIFSKKNSFIIRQHKEETTYNTMVVGKNGMVYIPVELKNELDLKPDMILEAVMLNETEIEYKIV